jgi:polysaccharide export outer membrane protein
MNDEKVCMRPSAQVAVVLLSVMLAGCAYAPGMRVEHEQERSSFFGAVSRPAGLEAGRLPPQAPGAAPIQLQAINAGLLTRQVEESERSIQGLRELMVEAQAYRIGSGDILGISVWSHPELNLPSTAAPTAPGAPDAGSVASGYTVSSEGLIQFPFVGQVRVGGLTEERAREVLTDGIKRYLKDPQVTVRVQVFRSKRIYLDGEFRTPGQMVITDIPMTLTEAIFRAGGLTPLADTGRMQIVRGERRFDFNLQELIDRGINPSRILLEPGDMLRVQQRDDSKVYVLGEVARPSPVVPMRNGRLSLQQALGEVGGVSGQTADPRQIYVVRNRAAGQTPEVFHLDARSPVTLAMADGFQLKPRDLVYVDAAPLALWNRVISLILPSSGLTRDTISAVNSARP